MPERTGERARRSRWAMRRVTLTHATASEKLHMGPGHVPKDEEKATKFFNSACTHSHQEACTMWDALHDGR